MAPLIEFPSWMRVIFHEGIWTWVGLCVQIALHVHWLRLTQAGKHTKSNMDVYRDIKIDFYVEKILCYIVKFVVCCEFSAVLFLMGHVTPEVSSRLAFSKVQMSPVVTDWMTNERQKEKTDRKKEPERLLGEERGREKERSIMMLRKDRVTRGEGEKWASS